MQILQVMASSVIFAFTLWFSLKIFAPEKTENTPGTAVFIGVIFGLSGVLFGYGYFFALPLVALFYLLIHFFDLGLIRSFCVIALMTLSSFVIQFALETMTTRILA